MPWSPFFLFIKKFIFYGNAKHMVDWQMQLLNLVGFHFWRSNNNIAEILHTAMTVANETNGLGAQGFGHLNGIDYISRIARGANADENILWAGQTQHLLSHSQIWSLIIGKCTVQSHSIH